MLPSCLVIPSVNIEADQKDSSIGPTEFGPFDRMSSVSVRHRNGSCRGCIDILNPLRAWRWLEIRDALGFGFASREWTLRCCTLLSMPLDCGLRVLCRLAVTSWSTVGSSTEPLPERLGLVEVLTAE